MFGYDPIATLSSIRAPVTALAAADDEGGTRAVALAAASEARVAVGLGQIRSRAFGHDGHNLMRYRPEAVCEAILTVAGEGAD